MKAERKYYWGRQIQKMDFTHIIRDSDVRIRYSGKCLKNGTLKAEDVRVWWLSNGEEANLTALELKEADEAVQAHWEENYTLWSDLHWEKM